jgi:hypothetical protein
MKYFVVFGLSFAIVSASGDWRDQIWSYTPDNTADWYTQHGQPLPEVAPEITTVEPNNSYVVKLECLDCPFRVRKYAEIVEEWQQSPQDNSLVCSDRM